MNNGRQPRLPRITLKAIRRQPPKTRRNVARADVGSCCGAHPELGNPNPQGWKGRRDGNSCRRIRRNFWREHVGIGPDEDPVDRKKISRSGKEPVESKVKGSRRPDEDPVDGMKANLFD